MTKLRKHISLFLFCLYIVAVGVICFMKGEQIPDMTDYLFGIPIDKVVHFLMFLPFTILAFLSIVNEDKSIGRYIFLLMLCFISGAIIAYGTERIQGMLGYRSFDINDLYADIAGLTSGALLTLFYIIYHHKNKDR